MNLSEPTREHPAEIFTLMLMMAKALWPVFALAAVSLVQGSGKGFDLVMLFISALGGIVAIATSLVTWWRFRFWIDDNTLFYEHGILSRKLTSVPLSKIENIDSTIRWEHRPFGVVHLQASTAEGALARFALAKDDAETLRSALRAGMEDPSEEVVVVDHSNTLVEMGFRDLALAGAVSGRVAVLYLAALEFVGDFFDAFQDRLGPWVEWWVQDGGAPAMGAIGGLALLSAVALPLVWLVSVAVEVVEYGGFRLAMPEPAHLLIKRGLLDKKQEEIAVRRIQAFQFKQGWLQQLMGLGRVHVDLMGTTGGASKAMTIHPLANLDEYRALVQSVRPDLADLALSACPPRRALVRYLGPPTFVLGMAAAGLWMWESGLYLLPLVLLPLALGNAALAFRESGMGRNDSTVRTVSRTRYGTRVHAWFSTRSIQAESFRQNPMQARRGLASLRFSIATGNFGGTIQVRDLDAAQVAIHGPSALDLGRRPTVDDWH